MTKCLKLDNLSKILINLAKLYLKKLDFINTVIPKVRRTCGNVQ